MVSVLQTSHYLPKWLSFVRTSTSISKEWPCTFQLQSFSKLVFLQMWDFHGFHKIFLLNISKFWGMIIIFFFHYSLITFFEYWWRRKVFCYPESNILWKHPMLLLIVIMSNTILIVVLPQPHPVFFEVLHRADIVYLVVVCQQSETFSPDLKTIKKISQTNKKQQQIMVMIMIIINDDHDHHHDDFFL